MVLAESLSKPLTLRTSIDSSSAENKGAAYQEITVHV